MLHQSPAARPRILVADDDDLLSEVVASALVRNGYLVDRAPGGVLSLATATLSDLVILDAHIPGVDFALTLRLLQGANIAVLVMSGELSPPVSVPADRYLGKPVDLVDLLAAVDRLTSPATMTTT
jgi:DNA-binding response OmpR family regulator